MPPAFNLSQDQTLQFDLCKLTHLNVGPIAPRFRGTTRRSACLHHWRQASLRCASTSFVLDLPCRFAIPRLPREQPAPGPQTTSTHTYRLQIVKERSACDSTRLNLRTGKDAAERRDNRMFFTLCQHPAAPGLGIWWCRGGNQSPGTVTRHSFPARGSDHPYARYG